MIKEWLAEYQPKNRDEADQALREIIQEITLAGLYRSGFFEKAAFYGGMASKGFLKISIFHCLMLILIFLLNPIYNQQLGN
jgi:hypothetical protein